MSDPWIPPALRGQPLFARGLAAIEAAATKALRAFGRAALGKVFTAGPAAMPDPGGILLAAPFWAGKVDARILTAVGDLLGERYVAQAAARGLDPASLEISKAPYVTAHLEQVRNRLVRTPDEVFDDIRGKIADSLRAGRTIPEIAAEVTGELSGRAEVWATRGTTVARTEAIGAWNGASVAAAREVNSVLGENLIKQWVDTHDARTRPTHRAAGGQRTTLGGKFIVGAALLDYPGDPTGPPGEVISCRCTTVEGSTEELDALAASAAGQEGAMPKPLPPRRPLTRRPSAILAAAVFSDPDVAYATDQLAAARQCIAYGQAYLDNLPDGADKDLVKLVKSEVADDGKEADEIIKWFVDFGTDVPPDPNAAPADGAAPVPGAAPAMAATPPAPADGAAPAPAITDQAMISAILAGLDDELDASLDELLAGTYQPALDYAAAKLAGAADELKAARAIADALGVAPAADTGDPGEGDAGAPAMPGMAAGSIAFTIVGDTSLPVGDYGTTWDGSAAAGRVLDAATSKAADGTETIDVAKASKGFIVRDNDGTLRGDYRLCFADEVNGELQIIPSGVQACAGEHGVAGIQGLSADELKAAEGKVCVLYAAVKSKYPDQAPDCPLTASGALRADGTAAPAVADLPSGWTGCLAPLDVKSSDRRMIATPAGDLRVRQAPVTLLWMPELSDYGHDGAMVAGRIDRAWIENGMIMGEGMFDLAGEAGAEAARQLALGLANGVSLDLGDSVTEWRLFATADDSPIDPATMDEVQLWDLLDAGEVYEVGVAVDYEIVAGTLACGQPAFDAARLTPVYGYASPAEAVPYEVPPALTAAGSLVAAAPPPDVFVPPPLDGPTPLTITSDGRVYGHAALWEACHIGIGSSCVTAPHSITDYAYFHTGSVLIDDGGVLPVGKITLGGGHASPTAGLAATMEHYDDAGTVVAVVRASEDEYGIALSGQLVDGATPEQIEALRRSPVSGDWRMVGGNLELVAALAVNVPGFPVVRSRGEQALSMVASLSPRHPVIEDPAGRPVYPVVDVRAIAAAVISETRLAAARERRATRLAARIGRDPRSRALAAAAMIRKDGD